MKVKVIDVTGARDLAIGKVYDVVRKKDNGNFVIVNEAGREVSFKASRFEVVSEATSEITYKSGDILKDSEGNKFILISDGRFVALADLVTGEIVVNGFHYVNDINAITEEEMKVIDDCEMEYRLVKA